MSSHVHSYLRTHRREWALTQKELALLLGRASSTYISRIEQGKRAPSTDIVLACEVLFAVSPKEMFPKLYSHNEEAVMARAAKFFASLEKETDHAAMRKKELLALVLKRAITRINNGKGV
ncbi:MAG: helix-turn-helix transcriptional regulator [Gammaproteobacteria bacterium]|nr:helix-turn-helix transcriptional regulator [Gammaproteobacteria bacterium]